MLIAGAFAQADDALTIERLVASPNLSGPSMQGLQMSPDGTRVTFLRGKQDNFRQTDLWAYDVATGKTAMLVDSNLLLPEGGEQIDEVEKARRERMRISTTGIVSYAWSPNGKALLFPVSGDIYYYNFEGHPRKLTNTAATETDPKISPEGRYVAYVRAQNVYIYDLQTDSEIALTTNGGGTVSYGMAQFVVQEELDRTTGFWWAPDDSAIAYTRIDEAQVPLLQRYEISGDGVTTIDQRYPLAGTTNASVQLFVAELEDTTSPQEINLGSEPDIYLARVNWAPNAKSIWYQRLARNNKTLDLIRADLANGGLHTVVTDRSKTWINVHNDFRFVDGGKQFIWSSERSGFRHLYLYDTKKEKQLRQLTTGNWTVQELAGVDVNSGNVYFAGFADTVLERHLYSVPLAGGDIKRISQEAGVHSVTLPSAQAAAGKALYINNFSNLSTPPQVSLRDRETGALVAWLSENKLNADHPFWPYKDKQGSKGFGQLTAADGQKLDYYIQKPADFDSSKTYPAIIYVYGGPGVRTVNNIWSMGFNDILTRNGYIVFAMDNRGMADRGVKFESPIYHNMGGPEVADQKVGATFLGDLPYVDASRIGVYGWSYGGYMSVHMLGQHPDTYAAGVSIAPVTDWALYDTAYTERYLGHPDEQPKTYLRASHFPYVKNINDPLLLVHGMADDNVFFDNSVKLMAALQENQVQFDLMTYPGKKHGLRGEATRGHLWTMVLNFFERELKAE
jgi:dipeptidyl-peptidase-4